MLIVFAAISPHPPIILPSVGSVDEHSFISTLRFARVKQDREKVKKTIESLEFLGEEFKKAKPDKIIISAPHPDWGFNVPLFFLAKDFKGKTEEHLIGLESPQFYFEQGKNLYQKLCGGPTSAKKIALIASGDLSHCLKADGPYGFQPDGPKFDKTLIESLKKKDIDTILKLDDKYPEAGECGLRSFCFLLGILEASGLNWQPEVLSYEGPFGVGYLVAGFKLK
jgi:aromatic ring-opening dioxygenase LigB subunit